METKGHIDPLWNIEEYAFLDFNQATIHQSFLDLYVRSGHNKDQIKIYNYFEINPMPDSINYIKSKFSNLNNLTAAINLVLPGEYLPLHSDFYERWKEIHNIEDIRSIFRVIVMLTDSQPGQILQIKNDLNTNWKAGDWFSWMGSDQHAIYNFSKVNRLAVQLTGVIKL